MTRPGPGMQSSGRSRRRPRTTARSCFRTWCCWRSGGHRSSWAQGMPSRRWAPGERLYRALVIVLSPLRAWVRLEVRGVEELRAPGGVLLVANHDSSVDPLALAEAAMRVHRPLRFLARANLWRWWPLGMVLDGTRQIPIERGAGDVAALDAAVGALRAGEVVCIFPEGTISRGQHLRARRG